MTIKVYAQNALDGLASGKVSKEYLRIIHKLKPDVVFFSEAYKIGADNNYLTWFVQSLKNKNYQVIIGPYDESDGRKDKHGMLLAVNSKLVMPKTTQGFIWAGTRNIAECWLSSGDGATRTPIHFLGMHLNDRNEALRQIELDAVLKSIKETNSPVIVAGDLNSLHKIDAKGGIFRSARYVHLMVKLKLFPMTAPTGEPMPNTFGRRNSKLFRLHEIAGGKTIQRLLENDLHEADAYHNPTFPADSPLVQLDHILVSSSFIVKEFKRLPAGASDHLGIFAELVLDQKK